MYGHNSLGNLTFHETLFENSQKRVTRTVAVNSRICISNSLARLDRVEHLPSNACIVERYSSCRSHLLLRCSVCPFIRWQKLQRNYRFESGKGVSTSINWNVLHFLWLDSIKISVTLSYQIYFYYIILSNFLALKAYCSTAVCQGYE